jgi:RNA polymerase sigma-54 factor
MEAIIKKQKDFFDNNGEGLKQIYEKDIAEDIRMDTSTVSRAVRGKYVQTDFGIYELRSFFTTPLSTNNGEDVSNIEAKIKLKELIDKEDKNNPLTDEELAADMNKIGFKIARRTIAKYREAINIPIAKMRREL